MSLIVDVAKALVIELNAGSFSQSLSAQRHYVPSFELPDMADLHVSVVPKGMAIANSDRTREGQAADQQRGPE